MEKKPIEGLRRMRVFTIRSKKDNEKINKGVYCYLLKKGCSLNDMKTALHIYASDLKLILPKDRHAKDAETNRWYSATSSVAQQDFEAFKASFFANKHKIISVKTQTYDDWFEEASMDGSFAYNGSAEDF